MPLFLRLAIVYCVYCEYCLHYFLFFLPFTANKVMYKHVLNVKLKLIVLKVTVNIFETCDYQCMWNACLTAATTAYEEGCASVDGDRQNESGHFTVRDQEPAVLRLKHFCCEWLLPCWHVDLCQWSVYVVLCPQSCCQQTASSLLSYSPGFTVMSLNCC